MLAYDETGAVGFDVIGYWAHPATRDRVLTLRAKPKVLALRVSPDLRGHGETIRSSNRLLWWEVSKMAELEEIIADAIVAGIAAWKKNDEAAMGAAIDRAVERITQLSASRE